MNKETHGTKGKKLSEWNLFVKENKGHFLSMKTLSEMYRRSHTVPQRTRTTCKGLYKDDCLNHQDPPCTWVIPKKPTTKGNKRKEFCTRSRKPDYNLSIHKNYID